MSFFNFPLPFWALKRCQEMLSLLHNISGLKVSKKKSCTLTRLTWEGHPKLLLSPSSLLVISFYFIF